MRTAILRVGLAALTALTIIGCSDQTRDPLSPNAQPRKAVIALGPCLSIVCQPQPNFVDVSAGEAVTCAVHSLSLFQLQLGAVVTASNLFCWGDNENGMLGVGLMAAPETCTSNVGVRYDTDTKLNCSTKPLRVAALRLFSAVSVGATHVCAIETGTGAAFCWGLNNFGQLGIGTTGMSGANFVPTTAVPSFAFSSISAGNGETCGITTTQKLVCWGNGFGASPMVVDSGYKSVSVEGALGKCAMNLSGATCAGWRGTYDFLGQGTVARHLCQIKGTITECWGEGTEGQLGDGHVIPLGGSYSASSSSPVVVAQPPGLTGVAFQSVATGFDHTCALSSGNAFCWGNGWFGALGTQTQNSANTPRPVLPPSGVTLSFTKISTGDGHTCGISGGSIWCWGRNEAGQIGIGTSNTWLTYPLFDPTNPNWRPNLGVVTPSKVLGT